jgi:hypothetical protein
LLADAIGTVGSALLGRQSPGHTSCIL